MSYAQGIGSTATDVAAITTAAGTLAASLIGAASGNQAPVSPAAAAEAINPVTGLPYGVNPATGLPYGAAVATETSYTVPLLVGGLVVVGIGAYFFTKRKSTPNRRRTKAR